MFPSDTVKALMQLPTQEDPVATVNAGASSTAAGAGNASAGARGGNSSAAARPLGTSPQFAAATRSYSTLSGGILGSALSSSTALQQRCSGLVTQVPTPAHASGASAARRVVNTLLPGALRGSASTFSTAASSATQYVRHTARQPGFFEMFAHVYRTAGMRGLYAGFIPTVIRAAPSNSVIFVAYEWTSSELKRWGEPDLI